CARSREYYFDYW
nr:immunoglobulin heavy chain junction region [Mus musculus]MBK4196337.1 immunoglobulin heavy chain junction region [Mus musculus]MBK4196338.1 immunoglobulin heavy chain junction region [Mus musculus]